MTPPLPIPETDQPLVACLRAAFHDAPLDPARPPTDWSRLFRQAQAHGVAAFLYPWLSKQPPERLAPAGPGRDEALRAWRADFLGALAASVLRRRQTGELLARFSAGGIEAVPLKGAWLGETVYDDPALRTMSDLDLLVRREHRDAAHALLLAGGYSTRQEVLHNPFARDQAYSHPDYPWPLELHWDFVSQICELLPAPDLDAIWSRTEPLPARGATARQLSAEDHLALLAHHLLGHLFALPLRAYLDLALLLRARSSLLDPDGLRAASQRWKIGESLPFLLRFTSALFEAPLPPSLDADAPPADPGRLRQAADALFHLPQARDRDGELTLLRFRQASPAGRLRLAAQRLFMPRAFLAMHYPCARHTWGLPLAWALRARDLARQKTPALRRLLAGGTNGAELPGRADERAELVRWLLSKTDGPA